MLFIFCLAVSTDVGTQYNCVPAQRSTGFKA